MATLIMTKKNIPPRVYKKILKFIEKEEKTTHAKISREFKLSLGVVVKLINVWAYMGKVKVIRSNKGNTHIEPAIVRIGS